MLSKGLKAPQQLNKIDKQSTPQKETRPCANCWSNNYMHGVGITSQKCSMIPSQLTGFNITYPSTTFVVQTLKGTLPEILMDVDGTPDTTLCTRMSGGLPNSGSMPSGSVYCVLSLHLQSYLLRFGAIRPSWHPPTPVPPSKRRYDWRPNGCVHRLARGSANLAIRPNGTSARDPLPAQGSTATFSGTWTVQTYIKVSPLTTSSSLTSYPSGSWPISSEGG